MKLTSLGFAAALCLAAGAATAQPAPDAGPGARAEGHHWQRPDPAQMAQHHAQHLRDLLQLRPDQEPALQALIAAMQPPAGEHDHMGPERGEAPMTTPERLDRMQARMAEHAARFQQVAAAVKRFYSQLTPAQQRAFDAMGPMMMGDHMHGMHGMDGMHDRMGGMHEGHGMGPGMDHRPPPPAG